MLPEERKRLFQNLSPKMRDFLLSYLEDHLNIRTINSNNFFAEKDEKKDREELTGNIAKIIKNRKYDTKNEGSNDLDIYTEDLREFLFPEFESLYKHEKELKDMDRAVNRFIEAILSNEKICIYSDYDCDGVPGNAMMRDFLEKINYKNVTYYIPDRQLEGYGLHKDAIDKLKKNKVGLIFTIDLGTTNTKEVAYAKKLGIDVIISDHHLPVIKNNLEILPKAYAILNPHRAGCKHKHKELCGSGIVFRFLCSVLKYNQKHKIWDIRNGYEKWFLDLVAIATVADMMKLVGDNRTLVIYGLYVLRNTKRQGLQTLLKNSKIEISTLSEDDIAYSIAPRINSASRMSHPIHAFNMLSLDTKLSIDSAYMLEEFNLERKDVVTKIIKLVEKDLDKKQKEGELKEIIIVGDETWQPGILGIIASKILDRYGRTVFVWGKGEDSTNKEILKGSCRSVGDINLVELMSKSNKILTHFGGHEAAGGFALERKNLEKFEIEILKNYKKNNLQKESARYVLDNQGQVVGARKINITLEEVTSEIMNVLSLLSPFGIGNPKPVFCITDIQSVSSERFGKNKEHLKLKLFSRNTTREAIKFFVDTKKEKDLISKAKEGLLSFTFESGWRGGPPRLKII